jgi:hypothetical protein
MTARSLCFATGLFVLLSVLLPGELRADRIFLRSGEVVNGQIINQSQATVTVRTRDGVRTYAKGQIARIQYGNFPDPEEERRKEEERERQREADRRRQEEIQRIEEERKRAGEEQKRVEEQRKAEEERRSSEGKESSEFSDGPSTGFARLLWDPSLEGHGLKVGLSVGSINHSWMGEQVIHSLFRIDNLLSRSQVYSQRPLTSEGGWHSTVDLEYGLNRYIIQASLGVHRQNAASTYFRLGPQRSRTTESVEVAFGNLTQIGTVQSDRMRWEQGHVLLGYRLLYSGTLNLDVLAGMHRMDSLADQNYGALAQFDLNPDRQYRLSAVRSNSQFAGPMAGIRGHYEMPDGFLPERYRSFLPDLEWQLSYLEAKGTLDFSILNYTLSQLYGSGAQFQRFAVEYRGTGFSGQGGFAFSLPYGLSLHLGGFGSDVLYRAQDFYNEVSDNDLAGKIRAEVFPQLIKGEFTTKSVQRGTYARIQWSYQF